MRSRHTEATQPGSAPWWNAHFERLSRRKPRNGGLTIERVVDEAVALVDAEGLPALTVRRLTAQMGTSSATLYRHVASVEELLVLIIDRVLGEISLPSRQQPARDRVVDLAVEFRRALLRHPGVVPALRAAPLLGPNAMRSAECGFADLLETGVSSSDAVRGYLALIDFVLGSVFFDTAGAGGRHARGGDGAGDAIDLHRDTFARASSDDVFQFALSTFLDGLCARA